MKSFSYEIPKYGHYDGGCQVPGLKEVPDPDGSVVLNITIQTNNQLVCSLYDSLHSI